MTRFISAGLADASRRLAVLTDRTSADDSRIDTVLSSSAAVGAIDSLIAWLGRTIAASASARSINRWVFWWVSRRRSERRRLAGVTLIVAASVHVAGVALGQPIDGWMWLIIPTLAAGVGLLTIAASVGGDGEMDAR